MKVTVNSWKWSAKGETWHVDDNYFTGSKDECNSLLSRNDLSREFLRDRAVQLCTCCVCGCTVYTFCQESYPTFNWPLRRTIKLCLELLSPGRQILQLHHHVGTI